MKFCAKHHFAGTDLARFERCFFDEPFNEALCQNGRMQRTLLSYELRDKKLARVVQIFPERTVPAPVRKLLGAERLGYTEYLDYTFGSYQSTWRIDSSVLSDKVQSFGTLRFEVSPEGGVWRIAEGCVNVRIFGLGGTIERFIVADVQKSYDDAALFMARYLAADHDSGAGQINAT